MSEEKAAFEPTFDLKNFSGVMREVLVFRMNQLGITNTANHFWQAQTDVSRLRQKLERAYKSAHQKAKKQDIVPEIWMFGAAAYDLITEQGMRLDAVLDMSGVKLAELAKEQGEKFAALEKELGADAYKIEKKSREKD